jgi:hypothetical protein
VIEACEGEDAEGTGRGAQPLCRRRRGRRDPAAAAVGIGADPDRACAAETPVVTVAMGKLYENALNVRIDDFAAPRR